MNNKTLIVVDHGLYTCVAMDMAKYFGKVKYINPRSEPYGHSPQAFIGEGLPGVERIDNLWKHIDKADYIFFPDVYDGYLQKFLRNKGYRVCGSGQSEIMELNKTFFKTMIDKVGLPQSKTYRSEGLDDVWEFLKNKQGGDYYIKNSEPFRGDWETIKYLNKYQLEILLDGKRKQLGPVRSKCIELLIEKKINSVCEIGADGFMLDGVMAPFSMCGYEIKDQGYIGKVFKELPPIVNEINKKLEPIFKKIGGYAGPYSTEIRITENNKAYAIDLTTRCPSPPTGVELNIYGKSYAQAIIDLSECKMPALKPLKKYGAEIILLSDSHDCSDIHIKFDPSIENNLKLKNAVCRKGQYYCVVNDNDGCFGTMVGTGNTIKEAINQATSAMEGLEVDGLSWRHDVFDEAIETIRNGQKHGINFS